MLFLKNMTSQGWWGNLQVVDGRTGVYSLSSGSALEDLQFQGQNSECTSSHSPVSRLYCVLCQRESTQREPSIRNPITVVTEEMKNQGKNIRRCVGRSVPLGPSVTKGCYSERFEDGCKTAF